ncbi:MAG TPA: hypothetical protein VLB44_10505 [Kofleriaceae bacterium]|nr:hypothetical protein [Kofleriaceae bacterium]
MSAYRHTPTARKVLRSLVPVICPPEAEPITDAIVDHMQLTFSVTPPVLRTALAAGFATYDLGALPRYFRRAHALSPEKAERYYESWVHGPTPVHKQFAQMLNQMMSLSCYEQPEMMDAIGFHVGPWIEETKKKRLTVFADDIKKQQARLLAPDPLRPSRKKEVA